MIISQKQPAKAEAKAGLLYLLLGGFPSLSLNVSSAYKDALSLFYSIKKGASSAPLDVAWLYAMVSIIRWISCLVFSSRVFAIIVRSFSRMPMSSA